MLRSVSATDFLHRIIKQSPPEIWYGESQAKYLIGENTFYVKFDDNYDVVEISFTEGIDTVTVTRDECRKFHESDSE